MFNKKITLLLILIYTLNTYAKEKISLQLDWLHQFQFAGYYMAKEKGFYKQNNLEVNIKEFNYNTNLLKNVLENKNSYAVGKSSLIIDKFQGKDIVLLAAIYQNSPMVLLSLKDSNINSIEDLKNKKVMLTSDARMAASINSMIKAKGLELSNINFIKHSFKLDDLINKKTDAMGSYLSNEPFILKQKNIAYNIFNPKDFGFDFYGGILFTSNDELNNHPLRVKNFYDASIKGWKYAFENIEETAKLIYEKYNTQNKSLESLIYEGKVLKELSKIDENLLGDINKKKIEEIKRLYLVLGFQKTRQLNLEDFIFDKNEYLLNKHEEDFLKQNNITLISDIKNKPYSYKQKNSLQGLEVDFWNLLGNKLDTKFSIVQKPKDIHILENIKNDAKYMSFDYEKNNIDNSKYILSNPISSIPMAIATTNEKNLILDLSLLKNKKIAILDKSNLLDKIKNTYPNIKFIPVPNIEHGLNLLNSNRVYAVLDDILSLSYTINKNYENIKITGIIPFNIQMRIKTKRENEVLINILNKTIKKISQEEKDAIKHKYQLVLYEEVDDYSWIYKFLLPLLVILIIISIFNTKMRKEIKKRKLAEKALVDYANKDSLTKVFNRRKIEKIINHEIKRVKRYDNKFSIIFFDIDNFKQINDKYGHIKGDKVLITLSKTISKHIRQLDSLGRWGGEEFIIILPQTSAKEASKVALNLKKIVEETDFNLKDRTVTSSFGISEYIKGEDKKELLKRADEAMYFVKENGKNSVKVL